MEQFKPLNGIFKRFFQRLCLKHYAKTELVVILHTFGKDLKFNPHLHILANSNIHFNFKFNKLWRKTILSKLKLTSNNHYYGYYAWSNKIKIKPKQIARYIGRYVRHPAIANGRIVSCNKEKITFFYLTSQNNKIYITKLVDSFITSLIQHIPPKQFKMVRYYGNYARNKKYRQL